MSSILSPKKRFLSSSSCSSGDEDEDDTLGCPLVSSLESDPSLSSSSSSLRSAKRRQISLACGNCRRAHTACNEQRPCGRCLRLGLQDSCCDAPPRTRKMRKSVEEIALGESQRVSKKTKAKARTTKPIATSGFLGNHSSHEASLKAFVLSENAKLIVEEATLLSSNRDGVPRSASSSSSATSSLSPGSMFPDKSSRSDGLISPAEKTNSENSTPSCRYSSPLGVQEESCAKSPPLTVLLPSISTISPPFAFYDEKNANFSFGSGSMGGYNIAIGNTPPFSNSFLNQYSLYSPNNVPQYSIPMFLQPFGLQTSSPLLPPLDSFSSSSNTQPAPAPLNSPGLGHILRSLPEADGVYSNLSGSYPLSSSLLVNEPREDESTEKTIVTTVPVDESSVEMESSLPTSAVAAPEDEESSSSKHLYALAHTFANISQSEIDSAFDLVITAKNEVQTQEEDPLCIVESELSKRKERCGTIPRFLDSFRTDDHESLVHTYLKDSIRGLLIQMMAAAFPTPEGVDMVGKCLHSIIDVMIQMEQGSPIDFSSPVDACIPELVQMSELGVPFVGVKDGKVCCVSAAAPSLFGLTVDHLQNQNLYYYELIPQECFQDHVTDAVRFFESGHSCAVFNRPVFCAFRKRNIQTSGIVFLRVVSPSQFYSSFVYFPREE